MTVTLPPGATVAPRTYASGHPVPAHEGGVGGEGGGADPCVKTR